MNLKPTHFSPAVALLWGSLLLAGCQSPQKLPPSAWDYKVLQQPAAGFETELNKMAQEGWTPVGFAETVSDGAGRVRTALLKRPKIR